MDVIAKGQHDRNAEADYRMLQRAGIGTVRDGLRWHLIETTPGAYDWTSFLPLLDAAAASGTQVIWDLCHWGVPDGLDVFSGEFVTRFATFAEAAARQVFERTGGFDGPVPFYCPINEISFWAWVGGDVQAFWPHREGQGPALKRQLVRASVLAIQAIRRVDPRARFVQAEPIIHIVADEEDLEQTPGIAGDVARHNASQFEAWDMLRGDLAGELGGATELLDVIGVNYYWNNQWVHDGERTPLGHPGHRPLHLMLEELWRRYGRPIVITETGAEAEAANGWIGYIAAEVRQAQRAGVPVLGVCLYPVMDYPGWDDERHCPCGLIEVAEDWGARTLRNDLAAEVVLQASMMARAVDGEATSIQPALSKR
ncbi:Beta-glucosidase/6-phospho-beta-glucosidase/beta-galactosidase [Granulicella rosea]|uniref:Beta-glucosidase/6-phospho-beta-glucosidase/beta-galactosidase n=2 Tax=Granulicella rosea TaxID=474952 RepID=A0A239MPI8_9BACT|nr:Beta-glucosidase/6-phospho-beta-glucosidase/beta-galactosidase [Granulicella rosea]